MLRVSPPFASPFPPAPISSQQLIGIYLRNNYQVSLPVESYHLKQYQFEKYDGTRTCKFQFFFDTY